MILRFYENKLKENALNIQIATTWSPRERLVSCRRQMNITPECCYVCVMLSELLRTILKNKKIVSNVFHFLRDLTEVLVTLGCK